MDRREVSDLLVERGRIEEAESANQEALTAARTVGDTLLVGYARQRVAYLRALRVEPEAAYAALIETGQSWETTGNRGCRGWDPLIAGHLAQGGATMRKQLVCSLTTRRLHSASFALGVFRSGVSFALTVWSALAGGDVLDDVCGVGADPS